MPVRAENGVSRLLPQSRSHEGDGDQRHQHHEARPRFEAKGTPLSAAREAIESTDVCRGHPAAARRRPERAVPAARAAGDRMTERTGLVLTVPLVEAKVCACSSSFRGLLAGVLVIGVGLCGRLARPASSRPCRQLSPLFSGAHGRSTVTSAAVGDVDFRVDPEYHLYRITHLGAG